MTHETSATVADTGFQPKIVAFICNRSTSVFFFAAPAMRAGPRKEKRLGKKKLGPALHAGRSLASLGARGD